MWQQPATMPASNAQLAAATMLLAHINTAVDDNDKQQQRHRSLFDCVASRPWPESL
jgi:hypothetical protein